MARQKLVDRIAIVTGASSGIGRATAIELAREGAHVALAARTEEALVETAAAVETFDRQALVIPTDVTSKEQVDAMVARTIERWGRVDILVANAGVYIRRRVIEMTAEDVDRALATNFYGVLHSILAVLPHMRARHDGSIVIINSIDGKKGVPPDAPYVVSKFALTGLGEILRQELRGTGVHVTSMFLGRVDTPMIEELRVPLISAKMTSASVGRAVVRAIDRQEHEVIIPGLARALIYVNTVSPRLGDWFVRRLHVQGWGMERK